MPEIEELLQKAKHEVLDTRSERGILQELSSVEGELRSRLENENHASLRTREELGRQQDALKTSLHQSGRSAEEVREEAKSMEVEKDGKLQELEEVKRMHDSLRAAVSELRNADKELEQGYEETVCEKERAYLKDAWLKYQMYTAVTGIRWDEHVADGQKGYIALDGPLASFDMRRAFEGAGLVGDHAVRGADYLWAKIEQATEAAPDP